MKDEKTLKQMVREYEQQMPPEIMNMIASFDWKRELREIVHQEALMLDVGTDLEESVYLLILGVVKVEDIYEDLVENHELSEDKAQKVLYEIEGRIFQQLNARLAKMDEDDERTQKRGEGSGAAVPGAKTADVSRDDILAEIEKDEVPPSALSNVVMPGTGTLAPASMEPATKPVTTSRLGLSDDASAKPDAGTSSDRLGLRTDAVSGSPAKEAGAVTPAAPASASGTGTHAVQAVPGTPVSPAGKTGISTDPIASGLSKPTVTSAPSQPAAAPTAPAPKSYASDPYREPIE